MRRISWLQVILVVTGTTAAFGQGPSDSTANEAAIRAAAASYAEAFNKHDPQSVADHWSPDAVYLNRTTGDEVSGREAIAEQFAALFEGQPNLTMEVDVESVQFVSPNVAVEQGVVTVLAPNAEPEVTEYSAVNVKRDGKWLLDRLTDKAKAAVPSHYEQLKPLEWMVGNWTDESDAADVTLECNWSANMNFLTRAFKIAIDGEPDFRGIQIIGWDPAGKAIRSWTFDSNGCFAEGSWTFQGDRWFISNHGVLPDGRSASMINVLTQVDDDALTWQTIERSAGDELLPNIDEIRIVRQ
ncbi:MAG: SgcJ/EcaC family oxidoreductase [Planctomycetaceae bacterium]|nr:SgcJ/EcaC family oxidoreductase [Planctomycetaceae bacterium]